jgi:formate dehydrogenase (coenzyme F420) beta subunit
MTMYAKLTAGDSHHTALVGWLTDLLERGLVAGVFTPAVSEYSELPMPVLITDPEQMTHARPLAPVSPFNAARQASSLLRRDTGQALALVLKPCEARALVELAKLKQGDPTGSLIIVPDCPGRMENQDYLDAAANDPRLALGDMSMEKMTGRVAPACQCCIHFTSTQADLAVCRMGDDLGLMSGSAKGDLFIESSGLHVGPEPKGRTNAVERNLEKRRRNRKVMIEQTRDLIRDPESFQKLISRCLNCYNCRVACPVCYCKECVFNTDVFAHPPEVYFRRARQKGRVKLPADTTMFHLTRLAHISHSCVGCGQCSSVCPSHLPVAEMFITVSAETQEEFGYEPGRSLDEPIPYLAFDETASSRTSG